MSQTEKKIEDILNVNRRWLPPSPHGEAILKAVENGSAYIEDRGHNTPPLLIFTDGSGGGVIELPKVRYENTYRGMRLISSDEISQAEQTRHPDVCGSIDELKGLLKDKPELVKSKPEKLYQLVDDACYMISRMQRRGEEYERFVAEVVSVSKQVEGPEPKQAYQAAEEIRSLLQNSEEVTGYGKQAG